MIYWWIGPCKSWAGKLNLGVVVLWFSSNPHWVRICTCAVFLFQLRRGVGDSSMCGCCCCRSWPDRCPFTGWSRFRWGGWMAGRAGSRPSCPFWPRPFSGGWPVGCLSRLHILPPLPPAGALAAGGDPGGSAAICCGNSAGAILGLHLLNSYIYFGQHPFWKYVNATAQTILRPLKNPAAGRQGGFCAGGGDRVDFSGRPFRGTGTGPALQPPALLRTKPLGCGAI